MTLKFTYWQEDSGWVLGYLNDYPEYWTQGENLEDLKEHLKDLYTQIQEGWLTSDKETGELQVE